MSSATDPAGIRIEIIGEANPQACAELGEAFARLLPQLSSSSPAPSPDEVAALLADPGALVFVARDETSRIVGSLTLVLFRIPTGVKARIEDVVVDGAARGRGIGELLSRAALDEAGRRGVHAVDLSSRPSREAANRLYQRIGFVERDTNVYRYDLLAHPSSDGGAPSPR